jgi:glutaminyl-peptide cyclotransferase
MRRFGSWRLRGEKLLVGLVLMGLLVGCGERSPASGSKAVSPPAKPALRTDVPAFRAESAYVWVEKQLSFGPRIPGTAAHRACGDWLVAKLRSYGAVVYEQKGTFKGTPVRNIIASFPGRDSTRKRLLLSAHWDSRPYADQDAQNKRQPVPGANDGASGVAVLLEIARLLGQAPPPGPVDIILWDAEDLGQEGVEDSYCLGSQFWLQNPQPYPPSAYLGGIHLDMVGAKGATFLQEGYSRLYAPSLLAFIWEAAAQLGYQTYFVPLEGDPIIDDPYYLSARGRLPMVNIIHRQPHRPAFFPEWHTTRDDLSVIDKATLLAVGHTLMVVIHNLPAAFRPV